MEVPESLKQHKEIIPFVFRSRELENADPVVSYYCKIYVLDQILNKGLHKESPEMESFTVQLLDETESFKSSEDEAVQKVLADKTLSVQMVINLVLKVLNSCLTDLNRYEISMKMQLMHRIRVCLNFVKLFDLFGGSDEGIDYSRLIGGKYGNYKEFYDGFVRVQSKTLKYHLSRLVKDEVEVKDGVKDEDLEKELDELVAGTEAGDEEEEEEPKGKEDEEKEEEEEEDSKEVSGTSAGTDEVSDDVSDGPFLPSAPKSVSLPGVPHITPSDEEDDDIKLPGAPKFLPDDDLSTINKSSSIHVFSPEDKPKNTPKPASPPPKPTPKPTVKHTPRPAAKHVDITKENIEIILDKQESIGKIQKHCKFAVSALNYEDLKTAEDELTRGLALLQQLKQLEQS